MNAKPDASGNGYIMGWCYNSDTNYFYGTNGTFPIFERGDYVVKYDALGNIKFITGGWGTNIETRDMSIDKNSNIFLTGDFGGTAHFGIGTDTLQRTAFPSGLEYFFVKLDSNGKAMFFQKDGENCSNPGMTATVVSTNDIIVNWIDVTYCNFGSVDTSYMIKFDNNGNIVWSLPPPTVQYGNVGFYPEQVAPTKDAGFLLSGYWFSYPLTFHGLSNSISLNPSTSYNGDPDYFLAKYSLSGNVLWAKAIRGKDMQGYQAITVDSSNNILIAMMSYDTCYFDNTALLPLSDRTLHIIKTDALGNLINYISFPEPFQAATPGYFSLKDLKTDKNGNIYLLGIPDSVITIGSSTIHFSNYHPLAIIKLDANFNYEWSQYAYQSNMYGSWGGSLAITDSLVYVGVMYNTPVFLNGSSFQFPPPLNSTTYDSFFACIKNGSVSTAVEEITKAEINIYPNPSLGIFTVDLRNCRDAKICVYDVLGNCLLEKSCKGETSQEINLSSQPRGIYFVELLSGEERVVRKVAVQ